MEAMGLGARAATLAARNPERTEEIAGQRRRLAAAKGMGTLFRVLAITAPGWPKPAGFA